MNDETWTHPVKFETGVGTFRVAASPEEAANVLLSHWPIEGGEKHMLARKACLDALAGAVPADLARKAFVEACDEAGMYVMQ